MPRWAWISLAVVTARRHGLEPGARLADGRSLRGTRRYRTCAKGRHPHR